jgi:hypothetical protein
LLKSLLIPAFSDGMRTAEAMFRAQIVYVCEFWIAVE